MEPDQKPAAGGGEPQQGRRIPNSDMQPEDAGTPESGNEDDGRANATETSMKETSKTDAESGGRR